MNAFARKARAVAVLAAIALFAVGVFRVAFAAMEASAARRSEIVVGSKAFGESIVLAEILSQWIESRLHLRVERRFDLGGTQFCFEALRAGEIDVYPEYTGTAYAAILHHGRAPSPSAVLPAVSTELRARYAVETLPSLGFDNTYALTVPRRVATTLSLHTISDLRAHPELRAGFATEFLAREDGWPGLSSAYGFSFAHAPRGMEAGLMYRAAASGDVDVISAYSTDGRIASMDLVVLDDDRGFFPPYEAVPLVRAAALARHPGLRDAITALRGTITDDRMRGMNAEVDSGRRSPEEIAREFLRGLPDGAGGVRTRP